MQKQAGPLLTNVLKGAKRFAGAVTGSNVGDAANAVKHLGQDPSALVNVAGGPRMIRSRKALDTLDKARMNQMLARGAVGTAGVGTVVAAKKLHDKKAAYEAGVCSVLEKQAGPLLTKILSGAKGVSGMGSRFLRGMGTGARNMVEAASGGFGKTGPGLTPLAGDIANSRAAKAGVLAVPGLLGAGVVGSAVHGKKIYDKYAAYEAGVRSVLEKRSGTAYTASGSGVSRMPSSHNVKAILAGLGLGAAATGVGMAVRKKHKNDK